MARERKTGKVEPIQKIWLSKTEAIAYLGCSEDFLRSLREKSGAIILQVRLHDMVRA